MPPGDRLVSLDEMCAVLGFKHRDSARRWARANGVPLLTVGRAHRLRLRDVRAALEEMARP